MNRESCRWQTYPTPVQNHRQKRQRIRNCEPTSGKLFADSRRNNARSSFYDIGMDSRLKILRLLSVGLMAPLRHICSTRTGTSANICVPTSKKKILKSFCMRAFPARILADRDGRTRLRIMYPWVLLLRRVPQRNLHPRNLANRQAFHRSR